MRYVFLQPIPIHHSKDEDSINMLYKQAKIFLLAELESQGLLAINIDEPQVIQMFGIVDESGNTYFLEEKDRLTAYLRLEAEVVKLS